MHASGDWSDDLGELRAFAMALVDDHQGAGREALAERLIKQACFARIAYPQGGARDAKTRVFREFIALHRRYVRKGESAPEDGRLAEISTDPTIAAMRALPLDLREPLLLTALSGVSHAEVAQTLDLPLPRLIERLRDARERLAEALDPAARARAGRVSYLRLVK